MLPRCPFTIIALILLSASLQANTDQPFSNTSHNEANARIVAVGDVHGALESLTSLLRGVGLIDQKNRWIGGSATLVSVGDLVDRGPKSRAVMDLMRELQAQANIEGGRVAVLLGNHEFMNLTGELRDVSDQEFASYQGLEGHRAAFAPNGDYGAWLLSLPVVVQIQDILFVHGGLSTTTASMPVDRINQETHAALTTLLQAGTELRAQQLLPTTGDLYALAQPSQDPNSALNIARNTANPAQQKLIERFVQAGASPLLGELGPLWYRGNAGCHPLLEQQDLIRVLDNLNATRIVFGHTPTASRKITSRLGQRAFGIDTGMLSSVYRGKPFALEIQGTSVVALDEQGLPLPINTISNRNSEDLQLVTSGAVSTGQQNQHDLLIETPETSIAGKAKFRALSRRSANRALAAYRLDQILGLNMVPAVAKREVNSKQGILTIDHSHWTDRQRQKDNRFRPNYCASGSAYLLLAAFDALIGKTDRDADDFGYQRRDWRIIAWNNHRAFGTGTKLPSYNQQPSLNQGMRRQLERLSVEQLTAELGDLLKPKEITALIKRRDLVLKWPDYQ